jgi:hypothetical protein
MSEWLKEHAWKTNPATLTELYDSTSRNRFNNFPPKAACRYDAVNVGACRQFRPHLTQFLHSSEKHLSVYSAVFAGACRNGLTMQSVLWRLGVTTISVELETTTIREHGAISEHRR